MLLPDMYCFEEFSALSPSHKLWQDVHAPIQSGAPWMNEVVVKIPVAKPAIKHVVVDPSNFAYTEAPVPFDDGKNARIVITPPPIYVPPFVATMKVVDMYLADGDWDDSSDSVSCATPTDSDSEILKTPVHPTVTITDFDEIDNDTHNDVDAYYFDTLDDSPAAKIKAESGLRCAAWVQKRDEDRDMPLRPATPEPFARPSTPEPFGRPATPEPFARPSTPEPFGRPSTPEPLIPLATAEDELQELDEEALKIRMRGLALLKKLASMDEDAEGFDFVTAWNSPPTHAVDAEISVDEEETLAEHCESWKRNMKKMRTSTLQRALRLHKPTMRVLRRPQYRGISFSPLKTVMEGETISCYEDRVRTPIAPAPATPITTTTPTPTSTKRYARWMDDEELDDDEAWWPSDWYSSAASGQEKE